MQADGFKVLIEQQDWRNSGGAGRSKSPPSPRQEPQLSAEQSTQPQQSFLYQIQEVTVDSVVGIDSEMKQSIGIQA